MNMTEFHYEKPVLTDFIAIGAKGEKNDETSCFIDCTSDEVCPDTTDVI